MVLIANSVVQPSTCQVVSIGTEIQALNGGIADGTFGRDGVCNFYQLGSAAPGPASPGLQKTVHIVARDPQGSMFRLSDGEADCTIGTSAIGPLCGLVTVYPGGGFTILHVDCNADPVANVAVYRGSATVNFKTSAPLSLAAGQSMKADLATGVISRGTALFTNDQVARFDAQLDARLNGVSAHDPTSLLKTKSLSPSDSVLAPNLLQSQLGKQYGSIGPMCSAVDAPVLFYPMNPSANTPRLFGSVCSKKGARIYGMAIYRPTKQFAFGGQFFKETGGTLIQTEIYPQPLTLEFASSRELLPWDGSVGASPGGPAQTPKLAAPSIYVAKFIYDLPPDTTPRLGLVAVSLFGAAYPQLR